MFLEPGDDRADNQLRFYDRDGTYLGCHSKILAGWRVVRGAPEQSEDQIRRRARPPRPLRTFELQGLTVGGLICNDLWAHPGWTPMDDPHLTQQLADMGARVVLHGVYVAGQRDALTSVTRQYHESNLRVRAMAGELWIVTVNTCEIDLPTAAPSGVLAPDGSWVYQAAPQGEDLFAYTIDVAD